MHIVTLLWTALVSPVSAAELTSDTETRAVFSIEPVKLSSLMLNLHPDWTAWGIEAGVRLTDNLWLQSFFEYDKGAAQLESYDVEGFDYLVNHGYRAWLNTARWYFQPDRSSGFVDAGVTWQRVRQQWLNPQRQLRERSGFTISPSLLAGYEAHFGRGLFFKVRGGGGWNAIRRGTIDGHLNLYKRQEQAWTYHNPHTHLTEVVFHKFFYIGDVAFGAKFGGRKKRAKAE